MPPHFSTVIHSTVKHVHYIQEVVTVECHLGDFRHVSAFRTPGFIACRLAYFDLSVRVSLCDILAIEALAAGTRDGKGNIH